MDTFFDIEAQERSRVTKLGAQTQHRVVLRLVPPSASKQSEIMCARDKCVVFHNIGKAISGSTAKKGDFSSQNAMQKITVLVVKQPKNKVVLYTLYPSLVQIERTTHAPALVQQFSHLVHPNRSHRLLYLLRQIADLTGKNTIESRQTQGKRQ